MSFSVVLNEERAPAVAGARTERKCSTQRVLYPKFVPSSSLGALGGEHPVCDFWPPPCLPADDRP